MSVELSFIDRHFGEILTGIGMIVGGMVFVLGYFIHRQWNEKEHGARLDAHDKRFEELEQKLLTEVQEIKQMVKEEIESSKVEHKDIRDRQIKQGEELAKLTGKLEK